MKETIKEIRDKLDQVLSKPELSREDCEEAIRLIETLDKEGWVSNDKD